MTRQKLINSHIGTIYQYCTDAVMRHMERLSELKYLSSIIKSSRWVFPHPPTQCQRAFITARSSIEVHLYVEQIGDGEWQEKSWSILALEIFINLALMLWRDRQKECRCESICHPSLSLGGGFVSTLPPIASWHALQLDQALKCIFTESKLETANDMKKVDQFSPWDFLSILCQCCDETDKKSVTAKVSVIHH
jgi:hypothetical protein